MLARYEEGGGTEAEVQVSINELHKHPLRLN